jgi:hypothetical protein
MVLYYEVSANLTTLKNKVTNLGIPDVFTDYTITEAGQFHRQFLWLCGREDIAERGFPDR